MKRPSIRFVCGLFGSHVAFVGAFTTVEADAAYYNGSYGEGSFQNNWQDDLPHAFDAADNFRAQVNNNTTTKFGTYNLHGTGVPGRWEVGCDACTNGGLDTADIVFVATHGGSWSSTSATWAMGDEDRRAFSENMRLGDNADTMDIFAAMSCETMSFTSPNQSALWVRWDSIMKGGLYAAVASHDTIFFGYYSRNNGKKFAQELQSGAKIRYAWRDGMGAGIYDQDVMALYAGNSSEDCSFRRSGLTWSSPGDFGRRRDSAASNYCYTYWDNQ